MIVWGWWTRGSQSATTAVVGGPQWAYGTNGHRQRVYPPRVRDDVWVMPGDLKSDDPALDTWEGEAT